MTKVLFILVDIIITLLAGCTYMFDNIDIYNQPIAVDLYTYEITSDTTVSVDAVIQGASRIIISEKGFFYLFDNSKLPDTSDNLVPGIENPAGKFHSTVKYSADKDSLFVRAFIVFGDSIVYSAREKINLNN
ncbi:MAG: hypothetical protein NT092_13285 [Bacteroidia bacterium]|nr:hypothetical protein [Bacteroidia bacterium]